MLASCSADKTVRIWQRHRGASSTGPAGAAAGPIPCRNQQQQLQPDSKQQQQWYCCAILDQCHTRTIRSVAWAPSGRTLATASFDATVAVWELSGGIWEQVAELEGHENEVKCVAWNPDGRLIATCGRDRSVWIWESMPGREFECVDVKQGHSQDVKVVRWHPGGELLVSAGYDDSIKLWTYDGDEWVCSQTLGGSGHGGGHTSTVWDVCWDPAGQRLASCSDDLTVRIWESRAATSSSTSAPASAAAAASPSDPESVAGSGSGGGAGAQPGGGAAFVPSRPDLRCASTLSGFHSRTVFSLDWGPTGLIATGDGDDCISVFGQGDPELARLLLQRAEAEAEADVGAGPGAGAGASAAPAGPAPHSSGGADGAAGADTNPHEDVRMDGAAEGGEEDDDAAGASAGRVGRPEGPSGQGGKLPGPGPGLLLSQPGGPWGRWAAVQGAHSADVNCVRWNPGQPRLLASCSDDGLIKLWWLR